MAGALVEMQPVVEPPVEVAEEEDEEVTFIDDVILYYAFDFLPVADLKVVRKVNKQWNRAASLFLSKKSRVFMKTTYGGPSVEFDNFVQSVQDTSTPKFMEFKNFELHHVQPGDDRVPAMLTAPFVRDSVTCLRIHGPHLRWLKPVLPQLPNISVLGFDDTHYVGRYEAEDAEEMPDVEMDAADAEAFDSCSTTTLEVHVNGQVETNPLNWLLPMSPRLKHIKLVIVNTQQLVHSVKVFKERYRGSGLISLRISGCFGYNWSGVDEKLPDRDGAIAIAEFLASTGGRNLRSVQIHAPIYPIEWRDSILNPDVVESIVSLTMDVYLRIHLSDLNVADSGVITIKPMPLDPEPLDLLSAFPMDKSRVTMPNLVTLKIDIDYRGSETGSLEESSRMVIGTKRIFPSLKDLEIDVRMCRTLPVDITPCFSSAFPVLQSLVITMASASCIKMLLLNLPKTVRNLRILASSVAGKLDNFPQRYEKPFELNSYRLTDQDFLDGGAIFLVRELTELSVEFNCSRLTDSVITEGFMKLAYLRKLALGGHPEFSPAVCSALKEKLDCFSLGWREEY